MSRHMGQERRPIGENMETLLLTFLNEEALNVIAAEQKVTQCLAALERQKERVERLKAALQAWGIDPNDG